MLFFSTLSICRCFSVPFRFADTLYIYRREETTRYGVERVAIYTPRALRCHRHRFLFLYIYGARSLCVGVCYPSAPRSQHQHPALSRSLFHQGACMRSSVSDRAPCVFLRLNRRLLRINSLLIYVQMFSTCCQAFAAECLKKTFEKFEKTY